MFYYADGSVVAVGDLVLIEDGRTPAIVNQVVRTSQEMQNWNVDEPGLMLASPPFGLVYYAESWLARDPLKLVAHA